MGLGVGSPEFEATSDEDMLYELWSRRYLDGVSVMRMRAAAAGLDEGLLMCICSFQIEPGKQRTCPNCERVVGEDQEEDPDNPTPPFGGGTLGADPEIEKQIAEEIARARQEGPTADEIVQGDPSIVR